MNNEITSTYEMAEADGLDEMEAAITATEQADKDAKIEFHVQMRSFTQHEMEALIVEAGAARIVAEMNMEKIAKVIQDRCKEMVEQRANAVLEKVTEEIIDQPVIPARRGAEPVTMREYLGLVGREYLETKVSSDGSTAGYGAKQPRIQSIAENMITRAFKREIEAATRSAISEVQAEMKARHAAVIEAEKKRFADAMRKITD